MDKPFFIMLYSYDHKTAMPIVEEGPDLSDVVCFYATKEEARDLAVKHTYCTTYGYEIFEMGTGA